MVLSVSDEVEKNGKFFCFDREGRCSIQLSYGRKLFVHNMLQFSDFSTFEFI